MYVIGNTADALELAVVDTSVTDVLWGIRVGPLAQACPSSVNAQLGSVSTLMGALIGGANSGYGATGATRPDPSNASNKCVLTTSEQQCIAERIGVDSRLQSLLQRARQARVQCIQT